MDMREGAGTSAVVLDRLTQSKRVTILAIDDDPRISEAMKRRFRAYDVDVLSAYHGMHGIALAVAEKPDLIITDLKMPLGEGQEVVECLQNNPQTRHIPIVVLTGLPNNYLRRRVRNLGAVEYLTKPVAFETLLDIVDRLVGLVDR